MIDKVEQIRSEIESRLANDLYNDNPRKELESLLKCIDSLQEEPLSEDYKKARAVYMSLLNQTDDDYRVYLGLADSSYALVGFS